MKNFNYFALGLAAIALLNLTGCGSKPAEPDVSVSPMPVKKATEKVPAEKANTAKTPVAGAAAAGSPAMMKVIGEVKSAIGTGDFSKAGEAVAKFEGSWNLVKPGIKAKFPKAYDTIEAGLPKLKAAVKVKDTAGAKSALTTVETAMAVLK